METHSRSLKANWVCSDRQARIAKCKVDMSAGDIIHLVSFRHHRLCLVKSVRIDYGRTRETLMHPRCALRSPTLAPTRRIHFTRPCVRDGKFAPIPPSSTLLVDVVDRGTFAFVNESEAHFAILSTPFRTVAHNPYPLRLPRNPLNMRNYIRDRPVFSGAPVHCNSTMLARSVSTLTSSATR